MKTSPLYNSWSDTPFSAYVELTTITDVIDNEIDRRIAAVAWAYGKQISDIQTLSLPEFIGMENEIDWIYEYPNPVKLDSGFSFGGTDYKVIKEFSEITFGKYADIQRMAEMAGKDIQNIPYLVAIIIQSGDALDTPALFEQRVKTVQKMPTDLVLTLKGFFLQLLITHTINSLPSLYDNLKPALNQLVTMRLRMQ